MASKVLKKINGKLKFLYVQSRRLTPAFKKPLCNALTQSHFDYRCSSWFPLLEKNLKIIHQKSTKQIYSPLPEFTSEISYRSIALLKNKLAST